MSESKNDAAPGAVLSTAGLCHIYAPPIMQRFVVATVCPDCKKRTRMLGWAYEWHGPTTVCLRCGREWHDGEWAALPFMRGARQRNIDAAKTTWRRAMGHNVEVKGGADERI